MKKKEIDNFDESRKTDAHRKQRELLKLEIAKNQIKKDSLDDILKDSTKFKESKYLALEELQKWNNKRFLWLSFSNDLVFSPYNYYNASDEKNAYISTNKTFFKRNPSFSINFLSLSNNKSGLLKNNYLNLSFTTIKTDGIFDSKVFEKSIVDSLRLGPTGKTEKFTTTEKKTFYSGQRKSLINKQVSLQYVTFFSSKRKFGLESRFTVNSPDKTSDLNVKSYDCGIGFIVPAVIEKDKALNKLNISFLFTFNDLSGDLDKKKLDLKLIENRTKLTERTSFSVRLGLPFSSLWGRNDGDE